MRKRTLDAAIARLKAADVTSVAVCYLHAYRDPRHERETLEVLYKGRNIAEVLEMTVREAFTFFRGRPKVQARLKRLIDVGLDYVRLGQPANTLSGGESQRLKLCQLLPPTRHIQAEKST